MSTAVSLKSQLIKSSLFISLLCAILGFVLICLSVSYSNDEVFDELLESNAHALLGENSAAYPDIEHSLQYLNDEMDIEYQVYNQSDQLISKTEHAPTVAFVDQFDHDSFYNVWQDGRLWRVYAAHDHDQNRFVQIAQPWRQRIEFALPIVSNYVGLMLLLIIALALGNAWSVRKNLKPLNQLREEISQKHLQNLTPITPSVIISETKPLLTAINALFTRLSQAKEANERFTADASHELRTPLSAVSMKLQLLARKYHEQPALTQDLDVLRHDVGRMTQLVESLLTLARLDDEATTAALEPVNIGDLINEVRTLHHANIMHKNKRLDVRISADVAVLSLSLNRQLILVALGNLIDNALKYGGDTICMSAVRQGVQLIITVADDGDGVDGTALARLGERFYRVLGTNQRGSGLGLSIVTKIAEYHHGSVAITTGMPLSGLAVSIHLPITQ
ncbi:ATP-binding protein [Moraxella sp. FZLJ2107]|uniref:ATP-binding protein n=1 Tax=unclassified Moraxella TaxID=2685852 RepID=UPI0020C8D0A0|nr:MULTISPECIES: ATP-binding protein [unclassified Moraxella]UTO05456.1 ATP-binding protein [Moraxella sp. FZLJ2107]UTO22192.1 ATP-binding protein [Moraxella sp. FZLJ2109]